MEKRRSAHYHGLHALSKQGAGAELFPLLLASIFKTVRQGKNLCQETSCGDSKECAMWQLYPYATVLGMHQDCSQALS